MPTDTPPIGPKQVHEIKWDGYRASIYVAEGKARSAPATAIRTSNGHPHPQRP